MGIRGYENMRTRITVLLLASLILAVIAPLIALSANEVYPFYPCRKCHEFMNLTGYRKVVEYHGIDLRIGAHRGLYCSSCHKPPLMSELVGDIEIRIPGLHNDTEVMITNKVCAVCHPRVYADYLNLVHGNKTLVCEGGKTLRILGYKGVVYLVHVCPSGEYKAKPAIPCVYCHDPHDPEFKPLSPLPEPSTRPSPPNEECVLYGVVFVSLSALVLITSSLALPRR